nr:hypothetical protein [Tanacetum cinerariifolium]
MRVVDPFHLSSHLEMGRIFSTPQLDNEDLEQIDQDDLKEINLKWQVAMLSIKVKRFYKKTRRKLEFNGKEPVGFDKTKVKRFYKKTRRKLEFNGKEPVGFDKTKVECYNYHRRGHFARDWRSARNSGNRSRDAGNARYRGRDNEEEATDFALMAFTSNPSSSSSSNSKFHEKEVLDIIEEEVTETMFDNRSSDEENSLANDRFKKSKGYHAVPPPLTGNYMPLKSDVSFAGLDESIYKFKISEKVASLTKDEKDAPKTSIACVEKPKEDRSTAFLIQD